MKYEVNQNRYENPKQKSREEKLNHVCDLILRNKADLEIEISKIVDFLNALEELVIKYNEIDQNMIFWHAEFLTKKLYTIVAFKTLATQLENISKDSVSEFFGNIDFFNFIEALTTKNYKLEKLVYIFKAQSTIRNIKYQFERIWNTNDKAKHIAIIKGMIAL